MRFSLIQHGLQSKDYIKNAAAICKKHKVLFVADEVQTGCGRTGKLLAVDHEGVKPDILILGKAISGGMMPVSCVLASDEVECFLVLFSMNSCIRLDHVDHSPGTARFHFWRKSARFPSCHHRA